MRSSSPLEVKAKTEDRAATASLSSEFHPFQEKCAQLWKRLHSNILNNRRKFGLMYKMDVSRWNFIFKESIWLKHFSIKSFMHCNIEKPKGLTDYSTYKRKPQSLVISLQVLVRGRSDFWYTSGCIVFETLYTMTITCVSMRAIDKNVFNTVAERAQRAAKRKNACKLRKQLH